MGESIRSLACGFQISHCIAKQTVWELLQLVLKMPLYLPSPSELHLTWNSRVLGKLAFPQLSGSNRGRKYVHTLCARSVAPPLPYTRIASCFDSCNTYLLWHTFVLVKAVSWQQNLFKIYNEKKYLLPKFWFIRPYQTAKFWKFLSHVITGYNVCIHVSSTVCRKKSQHKDSQ